VRLDPDAYASAAVYQVKRLSDFEPLTSAQLQRIRARARELQGQFRRHPFAHDVLGVSLLLALFIVDWFVLLGVPRQMPAVIAGALHGWLVCGTVTYTVHEGAAHRRIIVGKGRIAGSVRWLAHNACRLFFADPEYYIEGHASHHRKLGTREDGAFTHFIRGRRLLGALVPMAPVLSTSDFFPWRTQEHTASRRISAVASQLYLGLMIAACWWRSGPIYALVAVLVVGGWVSYALDRLRESTEHVFMPLDDSNGTRELGLGPWGLLLGAGPWGQPCHLSHHLAPALPWYQQLRLHRFLRRILTPRQREQFLMRPLRGWPVLLWHVARSSREVTP
jgi:hypothetical protein